MALTEFADVGLKMARVGVEIGLVAVYVALQKILKTTRPPSLTITLST